MSELTYLTPADDVGVESAFIVDEKTGLDVPNPKAGDPAPINEIGIRIPIPVMIDKELRTDVRRVSIKPQDKIDDTLRARIIPGTRVVETDHPAVVQVLTDGGYVRCDPPTKAQVRKAADDATKES